MKDNEYIDPKLREDIELKKQVVIDSPNYYSSRKRIIEEGLRSIGDVHSFWIENPDLRTLLLRANSPNSKKDAVRGIGAIKNGWHYLSTAVSPNVKEGINSEKIKRLNRIITMPIRHKSDRREEYRDKSVTLGFSDYSPPNYKKVPELMENLFNEISTGGRDDLESAIFTHLYISGVQPFIEGNKRTARLIQDAMLVQSGYPPAVIYSGEGTFYFNLLHEALVASSQNKIVGQRGFYDFIASKINEALDEIIGDLDIDAD